MSSESDSDFEFEDDKPVASAKKKKSTAKPDKVSSSSSSNKNGKKKKRERDLDDSDDDFQSKPKPKKVKTETKKKKTPAKKTAAPKKLKKLEKADRIAHAMQSFLWWDAPEPPEGCQWSTMEHAGVSFTEPYEPHGVKLLYDGKELDLSPVEEEA